MWLKQTRAVDLFCLFLGLQKKKKENIQVTLILLNPFEKDEVKPGRAQRTALVKQVFNASNSFAHRSFLSSCLPVVVAATHVPYAAACWTARMALSNTMPQRFHVSRVALHGSKLVWQRPKMIVCARIKRERERF